jgi:membrane fusion protein, cation efflux system
MASMADYTKLSVTLSTFPNILMKPFNLASPVLAVILTVGMPTIALSHAGHGDEFKAQGKAQRVQVNAETDKMLGITTTPIATSSGSSVMIPATALVEADGKKLAFVQFDEFYEPVEVVTGKSKGDQIEITQGLSAGEKLVTQGGLSLYSEALKAKGKPEVAAVPASSPAASSNQAAAPAAAITAEHDKAHAEGKAHSHDEGFSVKKLALVAGSVIVVLGGGAALALRKKAG